MQKQEPSTFAADIWWELHRAVLGGVSSATGKSLPEKLSDPSVPIGARKAHHAFACFEARMLGAPLPARPSYLTEEQAKEAEALATEHARLRHAKLQEAALNPLGPPDDPTPPPPPTR